jgi:hypothetical protein
MKYTILLFVVLIGWMVQANAHAFLGLTARATDCAVQSRAIAAAQDEMEAAALTKQYKSWHCEAITGAVQ